MILKAKEGICYYFTSFISPWSIADKKNINSSPKIYNVKGFFPTIEFMSMFCFFFFCFFFVRFPVVVFFCHFNYDLWPVNNRLDGHLVHLPAKQFIKTVWLNHQFIPVQCLIVPNGKYLHSEEFIWGILLDCKGNYDQNWVDDGNGCLHHIQKLFTAMWWGLAVQAAHQCRTAPPPPPHTHTPKLPTTIPCP